MMDITTIINAKPVQAFVHGEHQSIVVIRADGTREFVPIKGAVSKKCGSVTIQIIEITEPDIHDEYDLYPHDCGELPLKKGSVVYVVSDICYGDKGCGCVCKGIQTEAEFPLTTTLTPHTHESNFTEYAKVKLMRLPIEHL